MSGYLAALASAGVQNEVLPTYRPEGFVGKWWPWLVSLPRLVGAVISAKRRGTSLVVYSHVGAGVSFLREGIVLQLARLLGARTVVQLHSPSVADYLGNRWQLYCLNLLFASVDRVWVLTPWWQALLEERCSAGEFHTVPNPLPLQWEKRAMQPRPVALATDNVQLLSMARIEAGKGVDLVVEAMALLPRRFRLVVAGDGGQLADLRRRAADLGVSDRVHFAGWVSGDQKQALLDAADLFCLPTSDDSFGMGFLEAMANGIPVVALDWGPVSDVVPDRWAGILVANAEPAALTTAIEQLEDDALRQKLGSQAQGWVLEQFSPVSVGSRIRGLLDELYAD